MARKPFDYSKWDNIELSDDESDLHPNIDKDSWFRLKHRTRLEREAKEDQEVVELQAKNQEDQARINVIQSRLSKANSANKSSVSAEEEDDSAFEDTEALQIELNELKEQMTKRNHRIEEIHNKRQWNIDNICKVKEEKTIVNSIQSKPLKASDDLVVDNLEEEPQKGITATSNTITGTVTATKSEASKPPSSSSSSVAPSVSSSNPSSASNSNTNNHSNSSNNNAVVPKGVEPAATIKRERMAVISYNDFAIKHEKTLETFSEIEDLEKTKDYLFKNCDILLHEHAQSYMLLSCLEDEMNGKHKRMKLVARQSQILTHIQELGVSMKRDPRDVIIPFFKRIEEAQYLNGFTEAVNDFIVKIQKRAVEKRKEMDLEKQQRKASHRKAGDEEGEEEEEDDLEYEVVEGVTAGPGGLNPLEVLKKLPKPMRKAFESQDIAKLQEVLGAMDPEEAKYWMKQCVDSGLWVANSQGGEAK